MTDARIRCLSRPDRIDWPATNVVPNAPDAVSRAARETLVEFCRATSLKPLYVTEGDHLRNIENFVNTMTQAERVHIEIEMQKRNAVVHSFDYDPLR